MRRGWFLGERSRAMQPELESLLQTVRGAKIRDRRVPGTFIGGARRSEEPPSAPSVTDECKLADLRECLQVTGPAIDLRGSAPGCEFLILLDVEPFLLWIDVYLHADSDVVVRWGIHSSAIAVVHPRRLLTWLAIHGASQLRTDRRRAEDRERERRLVQEALPVAWVPYLDRLFNSEPLEDLESLLTSAYPQAIELCRAALECISRLPDPDTRISSWLAISMKIVNRQPVDVLRSALQDGPGCLEIQSGFLRCILQREINRPKRKLRSFSPELRAALLARARATLAPARVSAVKKLLDSCDDKFNERTKSSHV
jgi:hypothetical protein